MFQLFWEFRFDEKDLQIIYCSRFNIRNMESEKELRRLFYINLFIIDLFSTGHGTGLQDNIFNTWSGYFCVSSINESQKKVLKFAPTLPYKA